MARQRVSEDSKQRPGSENSGTSTGRRASSAREQSEQKPDSEKSSRELEHEAQQTRGEIESTLGELGRRLSPGQLLDQTLSQLRESDAGEGAKTFFANLGRTVRDNPLPVALTAAGLVWLASSSRGNGANEGWAEEGGDARGRLAEAGSALSERAGRVRGKAGEAGRQLRGKQAELRQGARRRAAQAGQRWSRMLDEQPLVLGLGGVALGALLGGSLPPTEREDAVLGEARDRALATAAEKGRETAEDARERAEEARRREEEQHSQPPPATPT